MFRPGKPRAPVKLERRYTKYVYLDVVQFSKRSAEAQSEIVGRLNGIIRQALSKLNDDSENIHILIPTGDGMCIAFINPNLPYDVHLSFALDVLKFLHEYNGATYDDSRKFQVRVGINQNTDILITDINGMKNVAGAGINLAARIMDKADGGQILVSQAVFHELEPGEVYMDKFKSFSATGKHDISFQVYQYIGRNHAGLNTDVPSAFASPKREKKKLLEEAAHYFAQAIIHRQQLLWLRAQSKTYWDYAAVELLRHLAYDSYQRSKRTEFDEPYRPTVHRPEAPFDEQLAYYNSIDIHVLRDAYRHVVFGRYSNDGLELYEHSECFEYSESRRRYEFLTVKGVEKLEEDWPELYDDFELYKYLAS